MERIEDLGAGTHADLQAWELALAEKSVAGDESALAVLLTDSRGRLHRRVANRIPQDLQRLISADDIVQQAHMDVFGAIRSFELRGADSFNRWVTTLAVRRLQKEIRKYRTAKRGCDRRKIAGVGRYADSSIALLDMLAGPGKTPSRSVAQHEAVEAVEDALADLPERCRDAVWLVHIEGKSAEEAAQSMGCTRRAVHGLCHRGLERMHKRLGSASRFLSSSG